MLRFNRINPSDVRLLLILPFVLSPFLLHAAEEPYHLVNEIRVPDTGPWTLLSLEGTTHRLYAITESNLFVVDLEKDQVIRHGDIANVHCFVPVPRFKLGCCVAGDTESIKGIDLNTFKPAFDMKTSGRPGTILADPDSSLGVAFCSDRTIAVFETDDGDLMGSSPLPGMPRAAVMDPKSRRVFCSIEKENQVVTFMAAKKVGALTNWSVAPGENPSALALIRPLNACWSVAAIIFCADGFRHRESGR
jgi:hypothetical protein